jgi:hypothetical protein
MGNFLLNDFGEVLLEINAKINLTEDMCLEINEIEKKAILKNAGNEFMIEYVHDELMVPLKQNRYLFVVERNNQYYALNSKLAKVIFIN